MKFINKLAAFGAMVIATTIFIACENDATEDIMPVAKSYVDALKKEFPDAKNITWELKQQYKVAEFKEDFMSYGVWLDPEATLKMTEISYGKSFSLVPDSAVQRTLDSSAYSTWTIDNIKSFTRGTERFYVIEVEKTGHQDMDVYIDSDGTLIKIANHTRTGITPTTKI